MIPKFLIPYVDKAIYNKRKISYSIDIQLRRWRFNPHKIKRVLINKLDPGNGIGDYVQSSPLVVALKQASPNVEISFLVSGKEDLVIFELFPYAVSVINCHPSNINNNLSKFVEKELRPKKFDLVIHGWGENLAFAKIISQKGGFINSMCYSEKRSIDQLRVFSMVLPSLTAHRPFSYDDYLKKILDVKLDWKASLDRSLLKCDDINGKNEKANKILGLHPGCKSNKKEARWSINNFKDIALWFHNQIGGRVLVFGGPEEEEDVKNMTDGIGDGEIHAVLNKPLLEVVKLISNCNVFVSNDSGLMNISMALGVPSIGIFGPTDLPSVKNIYPNALFLGEKMSCCPCYGNDHYISCIKDPEGLKQWFINRGLDISLIEDNTKKINNIARCLELIKPQEVIEKIEQLLADQYADSNVHQKSSCL